MVDRRGLLTWILGAGASLVGVVIGKRDGVPVFKTVQASGDVVRFTDSRPRVLISGAGEAFYQFVERLKCYGWTVETGEGWSRFDPKWTYTVALRAAIGYRSTGDWVELRDGRFPNGVGFYDAAGMEELAAKGVTAISSGGLTIDLT